jgi:RNase adaptor protein for sRNA GlmZ degradation
MLTGKDQPVIDFLEKEPEVEIFLNHISELVGQSIDVYLGRNFSHLSVSFGCTGGRHRSVYCAEALAGLLETTFPVIVKLQHTGMIE